MDLYNDFYKSFLPSSLIINSTLFNDDSVIDICNIYIYIYPYYIISILYQQLIEIIKLNV